MFDRFVWPNQFVLFYQSSIDIPMYPSNRIKVAQDCRSSAQRSPPIGLFVNTSGAGPAHLDCGYAQYTINPSYEFLTQLHKIHYCLYRSV